MVSGPFIRDSDKGKISPPLSEPLQFIERVLTIHRVDPKIESRRKFRVRILVMGYGGGTLK